MEIIADPSETFASRARKCFLSGNGVRSPLLIDANRNDIKRGHRLKRSSLKQTAYVQFILVFFYPS